MLNALYVLDLRRIDDIYGPDEVRDIASLVNQYAPPQTAASVSAQPALLQDCDVILSGWGAPVMDQAFLTAAPRLRAVFYGAGSIRRMVTDAFWQRDIVVCSAWVANGVPVAEYTLSQALFCLKRGWHFALTIKQTGAYPTKGFVPGAYGSTVGLISLGTIGRRVCELLRPFDLKVIAHDPFASPELARALNIELCSLDDVFRRSDVVSLHTPWLKETEGMITGEHFRLMKPFASFINTARGAIVREAEMIQVLTERPDIQAVLDVTWPEPPIAGSPLYTLPNVVVTPHIAGSMANECRRMGRYMVDDLRRYLRGEPLHWAVSRALSETMA